MTLVKTTVDEANLVLDTVAMRQRNEDSGFERGMRCAVAVNDGGLSLDRICI